MDLTEAEDIKKRWQEYTEELHKKDLNDSDNYYIYYCGQESLRRNEVTLIVNKRVWNAELGCNFKNDKMTLICFKGKPFNITAIQIYAPPTDAQEAEIEWFYEDLQHLLELTPR